MVRGPGGRARDYAARDSARRRPALVVSTPEFERSTGLVWVVMITSAEHDKQFGDMAIIVGLDFAIALRFAAKGVARMDEGVVIDLDERLERDAEAPAIIHHPMMMIGNAPGTWI